MKAKTLFLILAVALMTACGTSRVVPVTGRSQKVYSDNNLLLTQSLSAYKGYITADKLSTNATNTAMVKRVGQRLANAVETYLRNNGYADEVSNYSWEFNLVKENQVNAFCMPGGKIVVYEGLLPVTQTEAALAIVLGHEIAHAVAYHSSEQYQTQVKQQMIGQVAGAVLSGVGAGSTTTNIIGTLYGLGSKAATLKYSRNHETEADHIGLIFAAMAGYDPNEAVTFWTRMSASSGGGSTSWLSTHPSDAERIANIRQLLPEAMQYYNAAKGTTTANSTKTTKTSKASKNKTATKKTSGTFYVK